MYSRSYLLIVIMFFASASELFADSRPDTSLNAIARYSDWAAMGQVIDIRPSDCRLPEEFGPLLDVTLSVDEIWKGVVAKTVRFRAIQRHLMEPLQLGQRVVVVYERVAVECPDTTRGQGILPIEGSDVLSESISGEPRRQSVALLRAKFRRAVESVK